MILLYYICIYIYIYIYIYISYIYIYIYIYIYHTWQKISKTTAADLFLGMIYTYLSSYLYIYICIYLSIYNSQSILEIYYAIYHPQPDNYSWGISTNQLNQSSLTTPRIFEFTTMEEQVGKTLSISITRRLYKIFPRLGWDSKNDHFLIRRRKLS